MPPNYAVKFFPEFEIMEMGLEGLGLRLGDRRKTTT